MLDAPLRFEPFLRPIVCGGRRLGDALGKRLPTAEAFGATFWWPLALAALMLAPALLLPSARKRPARTPEAVTSAKEPST